jgi:hypothetical protein
VTQKNLSWVHDVTRNCHRGVGTGTGLDQHKTWGPISNFKRKISIQPWQNP